MDLKKGKSTVIIAVAIVLVAVLVGYFALSRKKTEPVPQAPSPQDTSAIIPETPDLGSEIGDLANPLGDKLPGLNPVEKTNPFTDVYKNPFE